PLNLAPTALVESIAAYRAASADAGRARGSVGARYSFDRSNAPDPRRLLADVPAGVDELILSWEAATLDEQIAHWRAFAGDAGMAG
nr:hypothetical protein [Chloroflexia bacterium]